MNAKITSYIKEQDNADRDSYKDVLEMCTSNVFSGTDFNAELFLDEEQPCCIITAQVSKKEYDNYDKMFYNYWNVTIRVENEEICKTNVWDNKVTQMVREALTAVKEIEMQRQDLEL